MPTLNAAQWALRAGANSVGTNLGGDIEHADAIKAAAEKRMQDLINGNSSSANVQNQLSAQLALVGVAVVGMQLAYSCVSAQLAEAGGLRLNYIKEREAGNATFLVPTHIEDRSLSREEKVIKNFVALATTKSLFSNYLGIHSTILADTQVSCFYSVLPFYKMSDLLDISLPDDRPLSKQRRTISFFLKSSLSKVLANIDASFNAELSIESFAKASVKGTNYLNDIRAARFLVISLSNLLWNLQHPVDPSSGYPLSLEDCSRLCRDVGLFLDVILDSADNKQPPYIKKLTHKKSRLISFVREIATYTKALRAAYIEEQLHEVNIDEVTNSAHQALEIIDKNILNLIYKRRHPETGVTDEGSADSLVCTLGYLRNLFLTNPDLIEYFSSFQKNNPNIPGVNKKATTVLDALILFCHMQLPDRVYFTANLKTSKITSVSEFAVTLNNFNHDFIQPIDAVCSSLLKANFFNPLYKKRATNAARLLIPFITLVIDNYDVDIDTPHILSRIKELNECHAVSHFLSSQQRMNEMNKQAASDELNAYYQWTLAPFLDVSFETKDALNLLIKHQYRMSQVTKLLDSIRALIHNYRTYLQQHQFQQFLMRCLSKVKKEYTAFDREVEKLDARLADDEQMPRSLKQILCQMTNEMDNRLDAFGRASSNFARVVGQPNFTEQERVLLNSKVAAIDQQFFNLFGEHSDLNLQEETLGANTPLALPAPAIQEPQPNYVATNKALALSRLAHSCLDGLSTLSQLTYKGLLLRNLIVKIDNQPNFSDAQFKRAIKELVSITASYSETSFFQAAYGETRSAKILIKALKDPAFNTTLPLGDIIFGTENIQYSEYSDAQIIHLLEELRTAEHWQQSCKQLSAMPAL